LPFCARAVQAGDLFIKWLNKGGTAMALFEWDETFSVNVVEIDQQHRKLVEMVNELHDAMGAGKSKEILGKIIKGLSNYAKIHFATEEKYFDQFGYPDADSHKDEHANFAQKVAEFKEGFDAGRLGLSIEVMRFLSTWLKSHIKDVDKKYGPFFNENGLK